MSDDNISTAFLAPPQVALDGSGSDSGYTYKRTTSLATTATTATTPSSKRRRRPWKKLLWVKQDYPDNYTDVTFLDSLQRNVNVRAYDFWPLVSDSTVIAQHLSSIVIFVTAFIAISEDKVNPGIIAGISTLFTVLAWLVWDEWTEREEKVAGLTMSAARPERTMEQGKNTLATKSSAAVEEVDSAAATGSSNAKSSSVKQRNKPRTRSSRTPSPIPKRRTGNLNASASSSELLSSRPDSAITTAASTSQPPPSSVKSFPLPTPPPPIPRSHRRLSTLKSAVLIYSTLLGLSPILKSLTESTMEDSIWALSSWLFLINVFCFDYGLSKTEIGSGNEATKRPSSSSGPDKQQLNDPTSLEGNSGTAATGTGQAGANALSKKLPTSLSTTTAMAASVVLASRLSSTSAVFYLLLFSIQIFGLFPLFRRRLRYLSLPFHVLLTIVLILTAAFALWRVLSYQWAVIWLCVIVFGLGGAAWWLMHLQKYKNEIQGPWDPAKPLLRNR